MNHKNKGLACTLILVQASQAPNKPNTFFPLCRTCLKPDMAPKGCLKRPAAESLQVKSETSVAKQEACQKQRQQPEMGCYPTSK